MFCHIALFAAWRLRFLLVCKLSLLLETPYVVLALPQCHARLSPPSLYHQNRLPWQLCLSSILYTLASSCIFSFFFGVDSLLLLGNSLG